MKFWRQLKEDRRKTAEALQEAEEARADLDRVLSRLDNVVDGLADVVLSDALEERLKEVAKDGREERSTGTTSAVGDKARRHSPDCGDEE